MARTANEKIMDRIVRHRQFVIGLENATIRELNKELAAARKDVLDRLVAASGGTLSPHDIQMLTVQIDARLKEAKDQITAALGQKLQAAYDAEGAATFNILKASLPVVARKLLTFAPGSGKEIKDVLGFAVNGVTYEKAIENLFNRLSVGVEKEVRNAFAESFHKALAAGTGYRDAVGVAVTSAEALEKKTKVVRDIFDRKAKRELAGIVRNHTQRALDEAQTHVYKQNEHLLQGVVYTATLDAKTCPVCAAHDGTMYWMGKVPEGESGELFEDKPELPLHPGCRCTYAPIVKSWQDLPVHEEDVPKSSKRLLDGDIPRPKKYEEWFNEQSTSTQMEILGKTRYELWKSGQVSLKDMATMDRTLSVKELKEKIAPAGAGGMQIGDLPTDKWIESLSKEEKEAIKDWTRGWYRDIRDYQLGRPIQESGGMFKIARPSPEEIQKKIDLLDKAVARAQPYEGKVYRGTALTDDELNAMLRHKTVELKAYTSATKSEDAAAKFIKSKVGDERRPALIEIKNKTGVDISKASTLPDEGEVLLRPGARYVVESMTVEYSEAIEDLCYKIVLSEVTPVAEPSVASVTGTAVKTTLEEWEKSRFVERVTTEGESLYFSYRPDEDGFLKAVWEEQGYDALPKVMSKEELDAYIKKNDALELWRGIKATDRQKVWAYVEQFKRGDYYAGQGIYGNGTYTAVGEAGRNVAQKYADNYKGGIIRMALKQDARIVNYEEIRERAIEAHQKLMERVWELKAKGTAEAQEAAERLEAMMYITEDAGRFASALGYDAIYVEEPASAVGAPYVVVLNRGKLIVQE